MANGARIYSQGSNFSLMAIGDANTTDQPTLCADAAAALARGNPAYPGLAAKCAAARAANVAAGTLLVDALPPDASLRVVLTDTGNRTINGSATLAAQSKTLSPDVQRGFAIGVKVATAAGGLNPSYVSYITKGMSADNLRGFNLGVAAVSAVKGGAVSAPAPAASSEILGLPAPVAIGIGVGLLGALAFVGYKLTR